MVEDGDLISNDEENGAEEEEEVSDDVEERFFEGRVGMLRVHQ